VTAVDEVAAVRDHRARELTGADVRALWRAMNEHYGTRVIDKSDATEMRLVARVLDLLGIVDREQFLSRYATTIARRIYVPFQVGEGDAHALWSQVVLCAHEHQHVVQHDRRGLTYEWSYLTSSEARARFEAEAYRCYLELEFWRRGALPSIDELARKLAGYGCDQGDIDLAAKMLRIWAVPIRQGVVLGEASRAVIDWLDAHVPHIRTGQA